VPRSNESNVAPLLLAFSGLSGAAQASFLDALNVYMYASPQQRAQQRAAWRCHCGARVPTPHAGDGEREYADPD